MTYRERAVCIAVVIPLLVCRAVVEEKAPAGSAEQTSLKAAQQLYDEGKFQEAAEKYRIALKLNDALELAQVGLALSLLAANNTDEALQTASAALVAHPDSSAVLDALGRIQFRRGEMADAEQAYHTALQINPDDVKAYVGLAHVYRAYSLYAHAYADLRRAHELDPKDPEVLLLWIGTLSRGEHVPALRSYLAAAHAVTPQEHRDLEERLHFLEKTADQPPHACHLVAPQQQEMAVRFAEPINGRMVARLSSMSKLSSTVIVRCFYLIRGQAVSSSPGQLPKRPSFSALATSPFAGSEMRANAAGIWRLQIEFLSGN